MARGKKKIDTFVGALASCSSGVCSKVSVEESGLTLDRGSNAVGEFVAEIPISACGMLTLFQRDGEWVDVSDRTAVHL